MREVRNFPFFLSIKYMKKLILFVLILFSYFYAKPCDPTYTLDLADTTTYTYDCGQIINPGQWVVSNDSCSLWTPYIAITDTPSHIEINIDITGNLEVEDTAWVWFYLNGSWILDTFYVGNTIPPSGVDHIIKTPYGLGDTIAIKITYKNNEDNEGWMLKDKSIRICGNLVTPINLIYFQGIKEGEGIQLEWKTATEINNDLFLIERSPDGKNFTPITEVDGFGTTSTATLYKFLDPSPRTGVNYYRLSQVDYDGNKEVFEVIWVEYFIEYPQGILDIFPNPNGGDFNIRLVCDSEILIVVMDTKGATHFSKFFVCDINGNLIAIDLRNKIPSGIHFIIATTEDSIHLKKILVQ